MSRRGMLAAAAGAALASGCAVFAQRIKLDYSPSKNVEKSPRQTRLTYLPFLDRRTEKRSLGSAPALYGLASVPLQPGGSLAAWAAQSAQAELAAAGYFASPTGEMKVGGALTQVDCGKGKSTVCKVKLEAWITTKDNWQIVKGEYTGEGWRPALFPGEDPYVVSLEEALRAALEKFRLETERVVP